MTFAAPRGLIDIFKDGALMTWRNLLTLVWLNLAWVAMAWTLILLGPATLAVYHLVATRLREDLEIDFRLLPRLVLRFLGSGLLWALSAVMFAVLFYANTTVWPRFLPPFGTTVVLMVWLYLLWLFVALQPFLLEALAVREARFLPAWRDAFLGLARQPFEGHVSVLFGVILLVAGLYFRTLAPVVLIALGLTFAAALVAPLRERPEPQDVVEEEEATA
ncbi:hypothetical protein [Deinococcus yavapaiensis]|uniref:Uncharacterized protein n=1 Tax=Deinococcus yavapaiensis KR-236 TaxID=694435 RepID=A0A318SDT6_9DEIO|nr:hypothetical protein [Deinococcus yavapaiensis]PYE54599.1 hypothetical protein DES52_105239 [Deinococcus yavapaiensis KR-236]